jgi:hypothetical protein
MARHEYISYKLVNPIITSWAHGKLDYSQANATNDFTMKLQCEAVGYGSGMVSDGTVEGFGIEHYDNTPSPLTGVPDPISLSPSFVKTTNNSSSLNTIVQQIKNLSKVYGDKSGNKDAEAFTLLYKYVS